MDIWWMKLTFCEWNEHFLDLIDILYWGFIDMVLQYYKTHYIIRDGVQKMVLIKEYVKQLLMVLDENRGEGGSYNICNIKI